MNRGCTHPELEQAERQPTPLRGNATPVARLTKSVRQKLEEWQANEPTPPIRLFPKVTRAIRKQPPETKRQRQVHTQENEAKAQEPRRHVQAGDKFFQTCNPEHGHQTSDDAERGSHTSSNQEGLGYQDERDQD